MSVSLLFKRLANLELQMEEPSVAPNADRLDILDRSYDDAWNDILTHSPQNSEHAELMLLLLLDKMSERAARGESIVQIREKIFDLFQSAHERAQTVDNQHFPDHANAGLI